jgi:hypothetical protein
VFGTTPGSLLLAARTSSMPSPLPQLAQFLVPLTGVPDHPQDGPQTWPERYQVETNSPTVGRRALGCGAVFAELRPVRR